ATNRNLPVGHSLQVTRKIRLAKVKVGLQDRRRRQRLADDLSCLFCPFQRAVDDAPHGGGPQGLANGRRLRAPKSAETEAWEVPIQQPLGGFDIRVAVEIEPLQRL